MHIYAPLVADSLGLALRSGGSIAGMWPAHASAASAGLRPLRLRLWIGPVGRLGLRRPAVWRRDGRQFAGVGQPPFEEVKVPGLLRVWAAGSGAPAALLVAPPAPGPQGDWQAWEGVAKALLDSPDCGGAVWMAEWPGLGGGRPTDGKASPLAAAAFGANGGGAAHMTAALAELAAEASAGGRLRLLAGGGSAGLLALRALRTLRLGGLWHRGAPVPAVAVVGPQAWPSPLRSRAGEAYPARLARRQRIGAAAHRLLASLGTDTAFWRWAMPDAPGCDPNLVAAWWLGLLDPVADTPDAVRELLLAGRNVRPTAGVRVYAATRAETAARSVQMDEAEDEDLAIGTPAGRRMQNSATLHKAPSAAVPAPAGEGAGEGCETLAAAAEAGGAFDGDPSPVLVLLPEAELSQAGATAARLRGLSVAVRRRLLASAGAAGSQGEARAAVEAAALCEGVRARTVPGLRACCPWGIRGKRRLGEAPESG